MFSALHLQAHIRPGLRCTKSADKGIASSTEHEDKCFAIKAGLTEIFRAKGSYFDCILQISPFGEPDQPQTCALFKLTHYRPLTGGRAA
jgi:hypothetical protein